MIIISELPFEWDEDKAHDNRIKHGVSFEEAQTVFYDDFARVLADKDHSDQEERFVLLGMSIRLRILMVVHCYRGEGDKIRIISARKATAKECKQYEEFLP